MSSLEAVAKDSFFILEDDKTVGTISKDIWLVAQWMRDHRRGTLCKKTSSAEDFESVLEMSGTCRQTTDMDKFDSSTWNLVFCYDKDRLLLKNLIVLRVYHVKYTNGLNEVRITCDEYPHHQIYVENCDIESLVVQYVDEHFIQPLQYV